VVTEAALAEHRDVVLNVRQNNAPAIAVYERLGYRTHATFIEGPALRRAPWERITNIWRRN
jgi:RimJ/RimL family protein N-acetyltransferase